MEADNDLQIFKFALLHVCSLRGISNQFFHRVAHEADLMAWHLGNGNVACIPRKQILKDVVLSFRNDDRLYCRVLHKVAITPLSCPKSTLVERPNVSGWRGLILSQNVEIQRAPRLPSAWLLYALKAWKSFWI